MSYKTLKKGLLVGFLTVLSSFALIGHADNNWTISKEAQGIQVYVRDNPGSAVQSFKGVITLPERLVSVLSVIEDTAAYPQLLHKCRKAKSLKKIGNNESYKYLVTDMPWPVKDRDTIVHSVLTQDKASRQVQINISAAPQQMPKQPGLLRITKMQGRWLLIPKKKGVMVVYEMSVDPGGNIPKWLVNTMAVDMPFNTLNNLRRLVKQPKYQTARRADIVE